MTVVVVSKEKHFKFRLFNISIEVIAKINGKPIELKNFHASITSNGFSEIGNHCFNNAMSNDEVGWYLYLLSTGNECHASTYSKTSDTVHQHNLKMTTTNGDGDWTGGKCLIANTTTPTTGQIVAEASWSAVSYNNGNTLTLTWIFTLGGTGFTNDGFARFGDMFLNPSSTYPAFDYISLHEADDTEWMREQATYTENSDTEHKLENVFTPAENKTIRKMRIYNAASGGQYCYEYDFGEDKYATSGQDITVTITINLN